MSPTATQTQDIDPILQLDNSYANLIKQLEHLEVFVADKNNPKPLRDQLTNAIANNLRTNPLTQHLKFNTNSLGNPKKVRALLKSVTDLELTERPEPEPEEPAAIPIPQPTALPTATVPIQAITPAQAPTPAPTEYRVEKYLRAQREYVKQFTALNRLRLDLEAQVSTSLIQNLKQTLPQRQAESLIRSHRQAIGNLVWGAIVAGHTTPQDLTNRIFANLNIAGDSGARLALASPLPNSSREELQTIVAQHPEAFDLVKTISPKGSSGNTTRFNQSQTILSEPPPLKESLINLSENLSSPKTDAPALREQVSSIREALIPIPVKLALSELETLSRTDPQNTRIPAILDTLRHYGGIANPVIARLAKQVRQGPLNPTILTQTSRSFINPSVAGLLQDIDSSLAAGKPTSPQQRRALENLQNVSLTTPFEDMATYSLAKQGISAQTSRPITSKLGQSLAALALSQNLIITPDNAPDIVRQFLGSTFNGQGSYASLAQDPDFVASFVVAANYYNANPNVALRHADINFEHASPELLNQWSIFLEARGLNPATADQDQMVGALTLFLKNFGNTPSEPGKINVAAHQQTLSAVQAKDIFREAFYGGMSPEGLKFISGLQEKRDRAYAGWAKAKAPYVWVIDKQDRFNRYFDALPFQIKDQLLARMGLPEDVRRQLYNRNYLEFIEKITGKELIPSTGRWSWLRSPRASFSKWLGGKTQWLTKPISQGWNWITSLPSRGFKDITGRIGKFLKPFLNNAKEVLLNVAKRLLRFVGEQVAKLASKLIPMIAGAIQAAGAALGSVLTAASPFILPTIIIAFVIIGIFIGWRYFSGKKLESAQITPIGQSIAEAPEFSNVTCSTEKGPMSSPRPSIPLAGRAYDIVADLYQGFWCYWNRSPDENRTELCENPLNDTCLYPDCYPDLFNYTLYCQNQNPTREEVSTDASSMFWCTQLIVKAYQDTGSDLPTIAYMSNVLEAAFISQNRYITANEATANNIPPGSVVFFRYESGPPRTNHVAMVTSSISSAIYYVQSNAGAKEGSLNLQDSGTGIMQVDGVTVTGFGLP